MADFLLTEPVDEDDVVIADDHEGNIFNEGSMTLVMKNLLMILMLKKV